MTSNEIDVEDRTRQLKVKAMQDIKNGSPPTKAISKRLFNKYWSVGRDRVRFEYHMEMVEMFNDSNNVHIEPFSSIEAHESFKLLEK